MTGWELKGLGKIEATFDRIHAETQAANRTIVVQSAAVIEAAAKANFSGSHKKGQPHVGGDKPNVVTGTLRRSITHDPVQYNRDGAWTRVGPTVVYARSVEITHGYAYFEPAVRHTERQVEEIAHRVWSRVWKG